MIYRARPWYIKSGVLFYENGLEARRLEQKSLFSVSTVIFCVKYFPVVIHTMSTLSTKLWTVPKLEMLLDGRASACSFKTTYREGKDLNVRNTKRLGALLWEPEQNIIKRFWGEIHAPPAGQAVAPGVQHPVRYSKWTSTHSTECPEYLLTLSSQSLFLFYSLAANHLAALATTCLYLLSSARS